MAENSTAALLNPGLTIGEAISLITANNTSWVTRNTAILVVHGIGNQLPMETIDQFGRGLIAAYQSLFPSSVIELEHVLVAKPGDSGSCWFDNVVRIKLQGEAHYIDLYEYYWANYTEDKADFGDIQHWLNGVTAGAAKFYKKIAALNLSVGGGGPFFNSKGEFIYWKYSFFLKAITYLIPVLRGLVHAVLWLLSFIPYVGKAVKDYFQDFTDGLENNLSNVIGDIVVYNVTDPKSKYYSVKRQILDGCVSALRYLIESRDTAGTALAYPGVIVAAHSLGTQVSYDAINKLNLLVNENKIDNYNRAGQCTLAGYAHLTLGDQLSGYITFGSPLDKIAFFMREIVPDEMYLRQQLLDDYHNFKQKNWDALIRPLNPPKDFVLLNNSLKRLLDELPWRNYYDHKDYVSGQLQYYDKLTNIDCTFTAGRCGFTHSFYWESSSFYKDIIHHFLQ